MSDAENREADASTRCRHGSAQEQCVRCPADDKVYWCDICNRSFAEKRCPQCGMKLRRAF